MCREFFCRIFLESSHLKSSDVNLTAVGCADVSKFELDEVVIYQWVFGISIVDHSGYITSN
jgi:hypothetical protein